MLLASSARSFGVVLWELLTRQRPYADADVPVFLLMMSLGNGTLVLPPLREEVVGAGTGGIAKLCERCMQAIPADRPSFREVLHTLEHEYKVLRGKAAGKAGFMRICPFACFGTAYYERRSIYMPCQILTMMGGIEVVGYISY